MSFTDKKYTYCMVTEDTHLNISFTLELGTFVVIKPKPNTYSFCCITNVLLGEKQSDLNRSETLGQEVMPLKCLPSIYPYRMFLFGYNLYEPTFTNHFNTALRKAFADALLVECSCRVTLSTFAVP